MVMMNAVDRNLNLLMMTRPQSPENLASATTKVGTGGKYVVTSMISFRTLVVTW